MQKASERSGSRARRLSFCLPNDIMSLDSNIVNSGRSSAGKSVSEQTWNPHDADPFAKKSASGPRTGNIIDNKTLYSIKRENIASRELGFLNRPPTQGTENSKQNNIEHQVEKNYILSSRLNNATPEIFPRVIMKHFFRISAPSRTLGYGMPRPDTRESNQFKVLMDGLTREPSLVRLDNYPDLQTPINCDRTSEFCEILGPSSCSECIENTNRHIGNELQHMLFPTIDMSTEKLILPKLAQVMREGHRHQVRKRRMHELGLDIPQELLFTNKRQESPLSKETCMNCKRKIKPAKVVITLPTGLKDSTIGSGYPSGYSTDRSYYKPKKTKKRSNFKF